MARIISEVVRSAMLLKEVYKESIVTALCFHREAIASPTYHWSHLNVHVRPIGRLRFHYNEYENDNEISLSLRFCKQKDERLVASISSSTTTISNRNVGRTQ